MVVLPSPCLTPHSYEASSCGIQWENSMETPPAGMWSFWVRPTVGVLERCWDQLREVSWWKWSYHTQRSLRKESCMKVHPSRVVWTCVKIQEMGGSKEQKQSPTGGHSNWDQIVPGRAWRRATARHRQIVGILSQRMAWKFCRVPRQELRYKSYKERK